MSIIKRAVTNTRNRMEDSSEFRTKAIKLFYGVLGISIFILLWQIVVLLFVMQDGYEQFKGFLPLDSALSLLHMSNTSAFWYAVYSSLKRVLLGLFIAGLLGVPAGLLIGMNRWLKNLTNAPIQFIRMISPISWMPIALIFLAGFEEAVIFLVTIASVWPIILNTSNGVQAVNKDWIKMAKNQGANSTQLLFRVILPATLPAILSGIRLAMGIAWVVLVPAEMLGISSGLGYLINDARNALEYDKLMAVIVSIGILGIFLDGIFQLVKKRVDWNLKK